MRVPFPMRLNSVLERPVRIAEIYGGDGDLTRGIFGDIRYLHS